MASPAGHPYARGFAADAATERALQAGLTGRDARIQRGRVAAALRTLAAEPAARLVFIDIDGVRDPEAAARQVIETCALETAVVAIGSTDTARFSRALLRCGVADYLVKPVSAATVREAGETATEGSPDQAHAGRVAAFVGSPGSGAATLIARIARGVAADGRSASVVDLDPVSGKLAPLLDAEPAAGLDALLAAPRPDAADGAEPPIDPERLDAAAAPAAPGISLIAFPPAGPLPEPPSPAGLDALFRHAANRTHIVLATAGADPETQLDILKRADARLLLYEPTLPSIAAAVRRLAWLESDGEATLVQCHPRRPRYTLSPAHVRYALAERRPDIVIPFEPAVRAGGPARSRRRPGKAYRKALDQVMEIVGGA